MPETNIGDAKPNKNFPKGNDVAKKA